MKLISFLVLLMAFSPISLFSQEKTFTFKAQVFAYNKPLKGAKVEVYDSGGLVFESTTSGSGKFSLELTSEKEYMVDISMENLRMKTIWINTENTNDLQSKIPTFSFDVHLKKEKITPYDELSEIPVTLIKYQPKSNEFFMDETYQSVLKNKRKSIKENNILVR